MSSVARYSLIFARQSSRQPSLKKAKFEDDAGVFEDELADCLAEEELEVVLADDELTVDFADDELTVDFTEEELTAFADEELPDFFDDELSDFFDDKLTAVLAEELDVAATEDELERFFTLEDDFRRSDGTGCSFPSSSYITYVTLLELSEHAEKAKTKDATAANFTKELFPNKLNFIINLYFFNR
jgi:hypothetical protein